MDILCDGVTNTCYSFRPRRFWGSSWKKACDTKLHLSLSFSFWWTGARAWLTSGKVGWSLSAPLICLWRVPICPYRKCAKDGGAESEVLQRGSPPRRHAVRSDQIAGARRRRRNRERFLSMSWEMGSCSDRNVMTASARFDL